MSSESLEIYKNLSPAVFYSWAFIMVLFDKSELTYLSFLKFTISLSKKAIVPHTTTIEDMYTISLCIEKL